MTTASEIQQLALDVFENKLNYKDNDFIVIMNILKESYMKVKGFLNENENVNEKDTDSEMDLDTEGEEGEDEEVLEQYTNYDSDAESDGESYTSTYLSPY
tara:strand:+ start:58 stop:357 length:300 start_codon:yes stop_codon:yes gene_type:complete